MLTLALVTCGPQLEVALAGGPLRAESVVRLAGRSPRSTLVLAAVDLLFEDAGAERANLGRVLVTRGPGSFTGIRAGLATAAGMAVGGGVEARAHDSLQVLAARAVGTPEVWCAQPGRRGEVYGQRFVLADDQPPRAMGEIEVLAVSELGRRGLWVAAESLDLGGAVRAETGRTIAEALLRLDRQGVPVRPLEPLYVEGPPIGGSPS